MPTRHLGAAGEGGEARDGPTELEALSCEAVQLKRGGVSGETVPLEWRPTLAKGSS